MGRRNLLVCFDAFGTLFKPKEPIAEQYAAVARRCGLEGFTTQQVQASFKSAFSGESKTHPNYGRASGMGAEKWWTNVIHRTFEPFASASKELPKDLAPKLLHRFSSDEGYVLSPGVDSLLRLLKHGQHRRRGSPRIIAGVITNSDDRVPGILSSFGLRVSPLRFGSSIDLAEVAGHQYEVDLHCMSYDVGYAKPDRRIFDAAEEMADRLLGAQRGADPSRGSGRAGEAVPWLKLYVGDEYDKDAVGARNAGWNAVFIGDLEDIPDQEDMPDCNGLGNKTLEDVFPQGSSPLVMRAESTQLLLEWLVAQCN